MMNRGPDRRMANDTAHLPARVYVLRDIAKRIEEAYPLESLQLSNLADAMDWRVAEEKGRTLDPSSEIAGATLFDRRTGDDRRTEPESPKEPGLGVR